MSKTITLPDGRIFPEYAGKPLSWSPCLYLTDAEQHEGYPRARCVLRCLPTGRLLQEEQEMVRASFDCMFGHNAREYLDLIQDELNKRSVHTMSGLANIK